MSRKNRNRPQQAPSPPPAASSLAATPAMHIRFTDGEDVFRTTVNLETGIAAIRIKRPEGECSRQVTYDSLRWSCACGAEGKVGRSKDGIPYVDEDILAHAPGEQRS